MSIPTVAQELDSNFVNNFGMSTIKVPKGFTEISKSILIFLPGTSWEIICRQVRWRYSPLDHGISISCAINVPDVCSVWRSYPVNTLFEVDFVLYEVIFAIFSGNYWRKRGIKFGRPFINVNREGINYFVTSVLKYYY